MPFVTRTEASQPTVNPPPRVKHVPDVSAEARRLFPDRTVDAASMVPVDPVVEREYLRDMLAAIQIGETAGDGVDPLAEFVTAVFEAEDEEDDTAQGDGIRDTSAKEQSDEAA